MHVTNKNTEKLKLKETQKLEAIQALIIIIENNLEELGGVF